MDFANQPVASNNKQVLWVVAILVIIAGVIWWVWGQLNFVVINKSLSQGNVLHVRYLKLSQPGFLTVNSNIEGFPGEFVGLSSLAPKGLYTNIWINLYEKGDDTLTQHELQPNERIFVKIYHDTNNDGIPHMEIDTFIKEFVVDL